MRSIEYGKIIRRSWELTKKNKWLWVFGLVLAAFGGTGGRSGGSSGGSSSGSSGSSVQKVVPTQMPQIQEKATKVLGDATNMLRDWAVSVPWTTWVVVILVVIIAIAIAVLAAWIAKNWARGSLIAGLDDADKGIPVTLLSESPKGVASIKPLILLDFYSGIVIAGFGIAAGLIAALGYFIFSFSTPLQIIWSVLVGVLAVISIIIAIFLNAFLTVYAERLIVFDHIPAWQAWKRGLTIARKEVMPTLLMGIINTGIGCTAGCLGTLVLLIVLGIPGFIIAAPVFMHGFHMPNAFQIIAVVLLLFIFLAVNLFIQTILTVFNYGNWNLFYNEIMKEHHE